MTSNVTAIHAENPGPDLRDAPRPTGWRMLIKPWQAEEVSEGGIVLADTTKNANKHLTHIGEVLEMGELCYADERFKGRKWCAVGDYVLYGQYAGQRFKYLSNGEEVELLLLDDDQVKAVTDKPKTVRAFV